MARKRSGDTREKLLEASSELFAQQGYRSTTVAEICSRAGANISAVNYYFGSKERLYQEAWRHSFADSIRRHPQDGGVSEAAPAKVRLWGQVKALLERVTDERNRDFFISQLELVDSTGLLEEVMSAEIIPLRQHTLAVVRELLGPAASEGQVLFCETSIISLCLHPMLLQRVRPRGPGDSLPHPTDDTLEFARHVVRFALAGMAAFADASDNTEEF
jgi:AcrR family transcriptional regulator